MVTYGAGKYQRPLTWMGLLFFLAAATAFAWPASPVNAHPQDDAIEQIQLSDSRIGKLEDVIIPAMESGDDERFLNHLGSMLNAFGDDEFEAFQKWSDENGQPELIKNYVDLKIQLVEQGILEKEKLKFPVAMKISSALIQRIQGQLDRAEEIQIMQEPVIVPTDWADSEKYFWEVHVAKNELNNAANMLAYTAALLKPHRRSARANGDAGLFDRVEQQADKLKTVYRDMIEREAETRLGRLAIANRLILGEGEFEEKLRAAMALEIDGQLLLDFFKSNPPESISRNTIRDTEMLHNVVLVKMQQARANPADVTQKAGLLVNGMHYWLRGRHGRGPLKEGLLKAPEAQENDQLMEALYMPRDRPLPISAFYSAEDSSPGYDRRHYYNWSVEYRELIRHKGGTRVIGGRSDSFFL